MRIMGNLYTDNLIGTVIGLSVADLWKKSKSQKGKIDNGK